jgi:ankyrin repeat protein
MKFLLMAFLVALFLADMGSAQLKPCPATGQVQAPAKDWYAPKLSEAIFNSDARTAARLIAVGVDLNERDSTGDTPLIIALTPRAFLEPVVLDEPKKVRELRVERELRTRMVVVPLLLSKGADPNASGARGNTPLIQIAECKWGCNDPDWELQTAKLLLSHGAHVDSHNDYGNTALMLASWEGKAKLVQLLLDHGADPEAKDCRGEDAIFSAKENHHPEVARLLEAALAAKRRAIQVP